MIPEPATTGEVSCDVFMLLLPRPCLYRSQRRPPQTTVYENARLIVCDGSTIENGTLVVDGARIGQAGPTSSVQGPVDARRIDLTGKTVMSMIISARHGSGSSSTSSAAPITASAR